MTFVGQTIRHKTLGAGTIEAKNGRYLTIRFGTAEKTFAYPDAFHRFLTAENEAFAAQATADLAVATAEKERLLAKKQEEQKYIRHGVVIAGDKSRKSSEDSDGMFPDDTVEDEG